MEPVDITTREAGETPEGTEPATAGKMKTSVRVFGIRHHGPGSARSLLAELEVFQPDCLLVEGPPEAEPHLALMLEPDMVPPVALLAYVPDQPGHAVYDPFAEYSPEWNAIRYGLKRAIAVRLIDMPLCHEFGLAIARDEQLKIEADAAGDQSSSAPEKTPDVPPTVPMDDETALRRRDPLGWLAEAAGFSDGERWWEHMIEHRTTHHGVFEAILEAMSVLRAETPPLGDPDEKLREERREAFMRNGIRTAIREGYPKIAVVCGAWHAPVLVPDKMPKAKDDAALIKGLPKAKVQATWVPWTNSRLCWMSGYRAGIESPGWYHYLWNHRHNISEHWVTLAARLFREQGLDASSAQVIDAVRTAESLAALRGRPLPGLPELEDAIRSIFCFGDDLPLHLVREKLMVGETLGKVPANTPLAPLMADLEREQKKLRFPAKASTETITLDLRKETDLGRSRLLHRLALLGVAWGAGCSSGGKGTFKEIWQVTWKPEFALILIERGCWGNTVQEACEAFARHRADQAPSLEELTQLVGHLFLAELPQASDYVVLLVQNKAAVAADISHLMRSLLPLCQVVRYGNVRQTDSELVKTVVRGMAARICVGLPLACGSLNEEAAEEMLGQINSVDESLRLLQEESLLESWLETLARIGQLPRLNGLLAGRVTRLLFDSGSLGAEEMAHRFSLGLSEPDPIMAASWLQGFLSNSGLILIHDERLWTLVSEWIASLPTSVFDEILPLVRRTFSGFPAGERRQMGEKVNVRGSGLRVQRAAEIDCNPERAYAVLPVLALILGVEPPKGGDA